MKKTARRKPTWILTVAAAYAVLPGCGDDETSDTPKPADGGVDATVSSGVDAKVPVAVDAGIIARPPDHCVNISDAGVVVRHLDAGGLAVGLTVAPPTNDTVIGFAVVPCADDPVDASTQPIDAGPFNVGLVARSVKGQ
jgi:hypothetical protein